jgi:stage V sporulation protein SpoVS
MTDLRQTLDRHVVAGEVPGAVALLAGDGRLEVEAIGSAALESGACMVDSCRRYARLGMLELDLTVTAEQALAECQRRGLVVSSQRELAGHAGSSHWHLRIPGQVGTLELSESEGRAWVKVHPLRTAGWATDLARELAGLIPPASLGPDGRAAPRPAAGGRSGRRVTDAH